MKNRKGDIVAEPWGEERVIKLILDGAKEGLVDLNNAEQLIKVAYSYGFIDGSAVPSECKHYEQKKVDCAYICKKCGKPILAVETRACSECKHFKILYGGICGDIPSCMKKHMNVLPGMKVCYKIVDGTCFESKK